MEIKPDWKRIAGVSTKEDGTVGAVWLAIEPDTGIVNVFDCCLWPNEVIEVVARRITNTSRNVPVAWANKPYAEKLLEHGVNTLPDPVIDDATVAAAETKAVWELMRTKQFFAKRTLVDWVAEYAKYKKENGKVPMGEYPLMEATWYAVSQMQYARAEQAFRSSQKLYPKIAMI